MTATKKPSAATQSPSVSAKVQATVEWLQLDIRRRGLRPGDRYMTSEEAAQALDVSTGTAHHAMRLLVEQNILQRRQKQGTFIGPAVDPPEFGKRPKIYVLTPADAARDPSYARLSEAFYPAISAALGGASLQLEYMPVGDALGFVRALTEEAQIQGNIGGFLLLRSTYEIQSYFQEQRHRFPSFIVGSAYPGITMLPNMDADQTYIGEHIAKCALNSNHQRMAMLMYEHWAPGDSRLISSVAQTLESSSRRLDRFEICSLPAYELPIRHRLIELLTAKDRPTLIAARMGMQVSIVFSVAKELGIKIPDDLSVVFANLGPQLPAGITIPHFVTDTDMNAYGAKIGKALSALRSGTPLETYKMDYPVHFVEL
jgi:DNA-binding LacI/PurR family transcriptional regulator